MTLLALQEGIIYGPIDSRRLGKSLGINLMPNTYKLCSFNCVYCHYGLTKLHAHNVAHDLKDLPAFSDIIGALKKALTSKQHFDYITFSGNGEPTLHPQFASVATELARLRDKYRRGVKIALLSNSTALGSAAVRKSISCIDLPMFKLDAGTRRIFNAINRPAHGINFEAIYEGLQNLSGIIIQTVLIHGTCSNMQDTELDAYFEKIKAIKPVKAQIYSIDRPVPNAEISRVLPEELEAVARRGNVKTGVGFQAFHLG